MSRVADEPTAREASVAQPASADTLPGAPGATTPGETSSTGLSRKIIYNAEVELIVEDFAGVPERVVALVKQFEGYVADSSLRGASGMNRTGMWRIRIPVQRFEEFRTAAAGLGELMRSDVNSEDVSEEFYDAEARVRNKKKEEDRLLKLLEERPGNLEDVVAIERELSRVREEIERIEGRLRVLTDLTSLATVEIHIQEVRDYEPPQAPTLATRLRRSWEGSLEALSSTGELALIGFVGLLPWIPALAVPAVAIFWATRRIFRRFSRRHAKLD
ncbi:MAG: DUF4349 domain-containing protein [Pirellulales bacterium]|nr:DUF4349 domain-containing protein [Pirellulales bacterium]